MDILNIIGWSLALVGGSTLMGFARGVVAVVAGSLPTRGNG